MNQVNRLTLLGHIHEIYILSERLFNLAHLAIINRYISKLLLKSIKPILNHLKSIST